MYEGMPIIRQTEEMIPGAVKRNPEQVEEWAQEIPKDKDVVVYCIRGGSVSNSVVDKLLAAGVSARLYRRRMGSIQEVPKGLKEFRRIPYEMDNTGKG